MFAKDVSMSTGEMFLMLAGENCGQCKALEPNVEAACKAPAKKRTRLHKDESRAKQEDQTNVPIL